MKNIICEKFKALNLLTLIVFLLVIIFMKLNYDDWFKGPEALDFYEYYYAVYSPLLVSLSWLSGILAVLLLLPSQIFKKWLFYVAPIFLPITYLLVSGISVYSTNLLNPTRAQMAENSMIVLSVVTAIFVAVLLFQERKRRRSDMNK